MIHWKGPAWIYENFEKAKQVIVDGNYGALLRLFEDKKLDRYLVSESGKEDGNT